MSTGEAMGKQPVHSVVSIANEELIRRAVQTARDPSYLDRPHPRWVGVMHVFLLGSNFAHELCRRHGFDPNENVMEKPPEGTKLCHEDAEV